MKNHINAIDMKNHIKEFPYHAKKFDKSLLMFLILTILVNNFFDELKYFFLSKDLVMISIMQDTIL